MDTIISGSFSAKIALGWGIPFQAFVCEACDWRYFLPVDQIPSHCPHCFHKTMAVLDESSSTEIPLAPPELFLPFTVSNEILMQRLQEFTKGLWFPPTDLTLNNIRSRLQRVFWPVWLVDSDAQASWQAEAGYDYQVVSHQERFSDGRGWSTQEVTETRIRWEPRIGQLRRTYQNIAAPAVEEHRQLMGWLGGYDIGKSLPFTADAAFSNLEKGRWLVCLPGRSRVDAWPDAVPTLQSSAADECQQACAADHIREFRWSPSFDHQNWTLLLLPMLTSFYLDDDKKPQPLLIHGQNGRLHGMHRASMKRAQRTALWILAAGVLLLFISLLVSAASILLPLLLVVGGIGLALSALICLLAAVPVVMAWSINRHQRT
jgi:hypothetical protein